MPQDDFILDFMDWTSEVISPHQFRLWSAISLLSGAMERRVWIENTQNPVFPNQYILLVAPPGIGKGIIDRVRDLWVLTTEPGSKTPAFRVAPHSITKAALIDHLEKSRSTQLAPDGRVVEYHSLQIAAEEFSILLPAYDMEFIGTLNGIWNNPLQHEEARRHGPKRDWIIPNPQFNILAGAQPSWLATLFPEDVWTSGLGRRMIMIYASEAPWRDIWNEELQDKSALRRRLLGALGQVSMVYGPMRFERDARRFLGDWDRDGKKPAPTHSKLLYYNNTRGQFIAKLAIVAAMSRLAYSLPVPVSDYAITRADLEVAMGWLFEAEKWMPDIFRAMIGKSDKDVIDELHGYTTAMFARSKHKPVEGNVLRKFLIERVPHDKIESLLEAADRAKIVQRLASTDTWVPVPKILRTSHAE